MLPLSLFLFLFLFRYYTGVHGRSQSCETGLLGLINLPSNRWLATRPLLSLSLFSYFFPALVISYGVLYCASGSFESHLILRFVHSFDMPLIVFIKVKLAK
jgi:hypothetical protein